MLENIFRKMCLSRYFELGMAQANDKGYIRCPIYLSLGQEAVAATISEICPKCKVFPQHRGHSWYLSYGGSPEMLRDEVLGLKSGCCRGMGGSSDIQCDSVEAHHGLLGENIPIAVGYALASNRNTIATFGDGAIEEDYAGVALGFAATRKLPVFFVCEDNGLAILTPIKDRRSWGAVSLARGYGLDALCVEDDPLSIISACDHLDLPALLNIKTTRHRWHVGSGTDNPDQFDRLAVMRNKFNPKIEQDAKEQMEAIWSL